MNTRPLHREGNALAKELIRALASDPYTNAELLVTSVNISKAVSEWGAFYDKHYGIGGEIIKKWIALIVGLMFRGDPKGASDLYERAQE